jgi:hypothetical protein
MEKKGRARPLEIGYSYINQVGFIRLQFVSGIKGHRLTNGDASEETNASSAFWRPKRI